MSIGRWIAAAAASLVLIVAVGIAALWVSGGRRAEVAAKAAPSRCLAAARDAEGPHPGMVWVPGGSFAMGDTVYPEEKPVREMKVAGFWIDRHEVTNDEFAAFVTATGYVTVGERPVDPATHPGLPPDMLKPGAVVFVMPNKVDGSGDISQWWQYIPGANWRHPGGPDTNILGHENYPVVAVALEDIEAYARWKGRSLPDEAQWEWAARGGDPRPLAEHEQPKEANTWQGIFPVLNSGEDGFVGLAPAGCYKPNGYGLYDMIGNVWEWTADVFVPGHRAQEPSQSGESRAALANRSYVIKGGSFLCAPNYCMRYRSGAREPQEADLAASTDDGPGVVVGAADHATRQAA